MLGSGLSNWLHFFFLGNNKSRMPRLGGKGEVGLKDWFCVDLYRPRECVWRSKTRTSTQKRVFLRNAKVEQVENHHTHAHTWKNRTFIFTFFLSLSILFNVKTHTLAQRATLEGLLRGMQDQHKLSPLHIFLKSPNIWLTRHQTNFFSCYWPTQRKNNPYFRFLCKNNLGVVIKQYWAIFSFWVCFGAWVIFFN